jgi:hypothetical protein
VLAGASIAKMSGVFKVKLKKETEEEAALKLKYETMRKKKARALRTHQLSPRWSPLARCSDAATAGSAARSRLAGGEAAAPAG